MTATLADALMVARFANPRAEPGDLAWLAAAERALAEVDTSNADEHMERADLFARGAAEVAIEMMREAA